MFLTRFSNRFRRGPMQISIANRTDNDLRSRNVNQSQDNTRMHVFLTNVWFLTFTEIKCSFRHKLDNKQPIMIIQRLITTAKRTIFDKACDHCSIRDCSFSKHVMFTQDVLWGANVIPPFGKAVTPRIWLDTGDRSSRKSVTRKDRYGYRWNLFESGSGYNW